MSNIQAMLLVVLKPILIMTCFAGGSYAIFKLKILKYYIHNFLSKMVLYVTLPMLLISKLVMATDLLEEYPKWYWLPVGTFLVMCVGGAVSFIIAKLVLKRLILKKVCIIMCTFHNAAYFPLAVVHGVFSEFPDLEILVMISVLGISPFLWSISPYLLSGGRTGGGIKWKNIFNPPMISILAGFLFMLINLRAVLEGVAVSENYNLLHLIIDPMLFVGEFTVPLILIVLGGSLSKLSVVKPSEPRFLVTFIFTKLFIMPAIGLSIIPLLGVNPYVAIVLMIATMQPSALAMIVQAKEFAEKEIGAIVNESLFYLHIVCVFSLTIYLTILKSIVVGWNLG